MVESAGRGAYCLGPQATTLADELSRWRHAEASTCSWMGDWIMVSTSALGRSDRSALRVRDRALALSGFRAVSNGLYLRPANLVGGVPLVRERLYRLGLEAGAPVFQASQLDERLDAQARQLWNGTALTQAYLRTHQQLSDWLNRSGSLDTETAARESYLLGNEAIRQLVFDPLLPQPLVDVQARRDFTDAVIAFDLAGRRIWQSLLSSLQSSTPNNLPSHHDHAQRHTTH
jgi:phenylacetic acid degradation operon negative regulatory protein